MKNKIKLFLTLVIVSIIFISCSREEPFVAPIVVAPTVIKMNEIYSRGVVTDPDWIEIYNGGTTSTDIGGYKIYDSGGQGGTKPKMVIATGTILPAGGYYVVVTDIPTTTDPSGFGLSSAGEEVWLEDKNGTVIEDITFPAMDVTQTYSRIPNGSATWALTSNITKGAANK
jgi:hypothetical protein